MSRPSKEFENRMQGMIYALNLAKSEGIEALESDIKKRGFTRAPMKFSQKDIDGFIEFMSENLYATTMTVWMYTLNSEFGFGKQRLQKLKEAFESNTAMLLDFDDLGNHYVDMEDYANYLNKKYDLGLDSSKVSMCQKSSTTDKSNRHMANVDTVIEMLRKNGYGDAAEYLEGMIVRK